MTGITDYSPNYQDQLLQLILVHAHLLPFLDTTLVGIIRADPLGDRMLPRCGMVNFSLILDISTVLQQTTCPCAVRCSLIAGLAGWDKLRCLAEGEMA